MKLGGLVLVAALALTACAPANGDGDKTVTENINGQNVRLDLAAGETKGLAVWFHGQGGDADTRMNEPWLNQLRIDGWAVASADLYGNAWGNADAVKGTADLVDWAESVTGRPATLFVAASMGGLNSLTAMASGHAPKCWYGSMPVVDVGAVDTVPKAAEQIASAGSPERLNLSALPAAKYRVLASTGDTWVPPSKHADKLTSALQKAGREVSTLAVTGEHGHHSHFNSADLAEFAKSCA